MYTETNLHVTFCDIEGGDTGVGETAGNSTTEHALGVVASIVGDGAKISVVQNNESERNCVHIRDTSTAYLASHFPEGARFAMGII